MIASLSDEATILSASRPAPLFVTKNAEVVNVIQHTPRQLSPSLNTSALNAAVWIPYTYEYRAPLHREYIIIISDFCIEQGHPGLGI